MWYKILTRKFGSLKTITYLCPEKAKIMKITKPQDMAPDLSMLEKAVKLFEEQFKIESKGQTYYHLVISGELNREVCREVKRLYMEAGWQDVQCRTSSDNGERPGLTGLILNINTDSQRDA